MRQDAREIVGGRGSLIKAILVGRAFENVKKNGIESPTAKKRKNRRKTSDSLRE